MTIGRFALALLLPFLLHSQPSFLPTDGPYSANVRALAAGPGGTAYVASAQAGLFCSSDDGLTWRAPSTPPSVVDISSFMTLSDTVYAGASLEKVYRSADNGDHWTECASVIPQGLIGVAYGGVNAIAVAPGGKLYASSSQNGVFVSTDRAASWKRMGWSNGVQWMSVDNSGAIYIVSLGAIYRSAGDSLNWNALSVGASGTVSALTVAPNNDVYAAVSGSVYRSANGGANWTKVYSGSSSVPVRPIAVMTGGDVWFGARNTAYRSTDNGTTWQSSSVHTSSGSTMFGIARTSGGALLSGGTVGGIYRSDNNGTSWKISNQGISGQRVQRSLLMKNGAHIILLGTRELHRQSTPGAAWERIPTETLPIGFNDIAEGKDNALYLGTLKGVLRTTNNGTSWTALDTINSPLPVSSLIASPDTDLVLCLTAGNGLFRLNGDGTTWALLSSSSALFNSTFFRRAPWGTLFVGVNQSVLRSTDGGATWSDPYVVTNATVADIAFGQNGIVLLLTGIGLFTSHDNGLSYSDGPDGALWGGTVLRTVSPRRWYAGTGTGLFRSTNGGMSWRSFSSGLRNPSVTAVNITDDATILLGTPAGLWRSTVPDPDYSIIPRSSASLPAHVGSSRKDTVVVVNHSHGSVNFSSITVSDTAFSVNPPSLTVPPGDSAFITVVFHPVQVRSYNASLLLTSPATIDSVTLNRLGTGALISLPNPRLSLPAAWKGRDTTSAPLIVGNTGNETLTVTGAVSSHPAFRLSPDSFSVLPGKEQTVAVLFAPQQTGSITAQMTLTSNAIAPHDSIILKGTSILRGVASFSNSLLFFDDVPVDSMREMHVRIFSIGNDTVRLRRIDSVGSVLQHPGTLFTIAPGDSAIDTVRVRPVVFGPVQDYVKYRILNDSTDRSILVYARGYDRAVASFDTRSIDAGTRLVGSRVDTSVTITNTGPDTLVITERTSVNALWKYFTMIPPGTSFKDTFAVTVPGLGMRQIRYWYYTNARMNPDTVTITVKGFGIPMLTFDPSAVLTIADAESSITKRAFITLKNTGEDTLHITGSISTSPHFWASGTLFHIPPHQSAVDTVRFTPDHSGADSCRIIYAANTPSGAETLFVYGNGIPLDTWVLRNTFPANTLLNISMASDGSLIAGTAYRIWYSRDGGITWSKAVTPDTIPFASNFITLPTGTLLASSTKHGILRSTDNGAHWSKITVPDPSVPITGVVRSAKGTVLALRYFSGSTYPAFLVSPDDGKTWQPYTSNLFADKSRTELRSTSNGSLFMTDASGAAPVLLRSVDDGRMWQTISTVSAVKPQRFLREGVNGRLFALSADGAMVSQDDGTTWKLIFASAFIKDIFETKDSVWYVSVNGETIKRSTDLGVLWTDLPIPPINTFKTPFIRHYNGTLWWGYNSGIFSSRDPIGGREQVETIHGVIRTGPVPVGAELILTVPLFNNTSDTLRQIIRSISHPHFSLRFAGKNVPPGTAVVDSVVYSSSAASVVDTAVMTYQTIAGTASVTIIGQPVGPDGVSGPSGTVHDFALAPNFPNPFNPTTTIRFTLPARSRTTVRIYSVMGREVARLHEGVLEAGPHSLRWDASGLPSGVYLCRMESDGHTAVQRMVLLK